ncbi:DUF974 domain-containing protein [Metarhizium album ARSEF 1941]|uniref:DUF974 domain-containing protein n=1 Tax=Metarhizium album (strain ARSEF 1941) TaxID=1081103 RepID=A0A0B2X0E3_METAS|nr:DUF974 domain-containing protein [Metarhizium album ARSEF 1941]KHO02012.1 DUF974 domain-containing protein [Metarhizium album ARSEF 1941]
MSQPRYSSHDPIKEPHAVSVKVLRLSRPSLVPQYPSSPLAATAAKGAAALTHPPYLLSSLSYRTASATNPAPFLLSPIVNLPVSFGSAYVGETFSCTLCANNDVASSSPSPPGKQIRHVRIEAEMKTPGLGGAHKLPLADGPPADLAAGETLQKVVSFDLKEEGNHVLAVTVSYYEAGETSGRTRTFRKLYQFMCKASLIVRTKVGLLGGEEGGGGSSSRRRRRRWLLEAQLENCSQDVMQLDKVGMEPERGLRCQGCNWAGGEKPVLHPGEVEQVCFVVEEAEEAEEGSRAGGDADGKVVFGVLGIGWRGEMGNRGFLSTGKLGTRVVG